MASDMIRIKTGISVNWVAGSTREDSIEIPRAEWEAKTEAEREDYLNDVTSTLIANGVDVWAYAEEDEA
jgi:hypothetical protein